MAPPTPIRLPTLVLAVGVILGDSFRINNHCLTTPWVDNLPRRASSSHPRWAARPSRRPSSTAALLDQEEASSGDGGITDDSLLGRVQAAETAAAADTEDLDDEAERLHREVFANEKGFLASATFNPKLAREKEEEEEAKRLATEWGSTPERAKGVMKRTKSGKKMSFQELEKIAQELNMSDEQQRAFMLKASMKNLSVSTTLPKREPRNPVKEAVAERVFASEKGFLQNSEAFKSRMKVGSGVRFDSEGFPVMEEGDPVISASRKSRPPEMSGVEGVVFPSIPDCPCCSTPTMEDELLRFGMCSQCKGREISAAAYRGPAVASKYTYDNGEAPFSSSWYSPQPTAGKKSPGQLTSEPVARKSNNSVITDSIGGVPAKNAPPIRSAVPGPSRITHGPTSPGDGIAASRIAPAAPAAKRKKSAPPPPQPPATAVGAGTAPTAAETPYRASSPHAPPPVSNVPARRATDMTGDRSRDASQGATSGQGDEATRKLSLEVAELRSHLVSTRAALERIGARGAGGPAPGAAKDEQRDAVVRKLRREVAELRMELSGTTDKAGAAGPATRGGGTEAMQALSREVTELRSQLENARKEQAMTRTALRRLRDEIDDLAVKVARR